MSKLTMDAALGELFSHAGSLHPSLGEGLELGPDIYEDILIWALDDERFVYWHASEENWRLSLTGTPGSGKVRFCNTDIFRNLPAIRH